MLQAHSWRILLINFQWVNIIRLNIILTGLLFCKVPKATVMALDFCTEHGAWYRSIRSEFIITKSAHWTYFCYCCCTLAVYLCVCLFLSLFLVRVCLPAVCCALRTNVARESLRPVTVFVHITLKKNLFTWLLVRILKWHECLNLLFSTSVFKEWVALYTQAHIQWKKKMWTKEMVY